MGENPYLIQCKGVPEGDRREECLIFHCQSNLIQARLKFSESEWTNRAHYGHRGSANEIKQPIDQFACQHQKGHLVS